MTKRKRIFSLIIYLSVITVNAQNTVKSASVLTKEQKDYLLQFVYPLKSCEPETEGTEDLKILNKLVGNSKIVGLGEVTHGSSEIFKMKDRIIRFLSKNNNFDIFSIEAAMPESYLMNNYVIQGKNEPKMYLEKMYFWTWNVREVYDLVSWMKEYNDSNTKKIKFTGFDMQHFYGAINELKELNTKNNLGNENLENLKSILIDIKKKTIEKKSRITVVDSTQKNELNSILEKNKLNSEKFTYEDKKWANQNVRVIEQFLDKSSSNRDKYMAENIFWIKENNPNSKLILWAHNAHIKKTETSMGKYLSEKLNDDYKTIGFTFYKGSYTAIGKESKKVGTYTSQEAYEGTLEYFLNSLDLPIFILDLKAIKQENDILGEWILKEIPYRRTGAVSMGNNEFKKVNISKDFDYLIFIRESTNSKLLKNTN